MSDAAESEGPLLSVRGLSVGFATDGGVVHALDRVSFDVGRGRAVALVGESGSGKTTIASSILRLLPERIGSIDAGEIVFEGRDLLGLSERRMREVRGGRISMIFQEPMTSLDPVYSIGSQISEAIRLHTPASRAEARARAIELLRKVGFPEPERRIDDYPHELSGGMRQRVLIAIALACDPRLVIADEPTTALDMTVQAQILELLSRLKRELGMSLLLIAHDFAVVAQIADEVVVLYAGQIVERGSVAEVLRAPRHPYSVALRRSIPTREGAPRKHGDKGRRLPTIEGTVPDLRETPVGCRFHSRCVSVMDRCKKEVPELVAVDSPNGRVLVRCFLFGPGAEPRATLRSEDEPIPLTAERRKATEPSEAP